MKTPNIVALCLAMSIAGMRAQTTAGLPNQTGAPTNAPVPTSYHVVDIGPNHRVWQREIYESGSNGKIITRVHKYTEMATGMYYKDAQGNWIESKDLIESFQNGAIARQGNHQVIFANNLNSEGSVDHQTADGHRLQSNILGLGYYDWAAHTNVLFAQIQDSQGELISTNQVLYPNAFNGVHADVRYTYKRATFEQDVILRDQPPTPESFGLDPETTEIEVLTEFIDPPQARLVAHAVRDTGLIDEDVIWGATRLGKGMAFSLGESQSDQPPFRVRRQYVKMDGRTILIESVPLKEIKSRLTKLPLQSNASTKLLMFASKALVVPQTRVGKKLPGPMKLAQSALANKGFVLDYVALNADTNNFTFQGDTTYCINGPVYITGNTLFEGGAVLKYPEDASATLSTVDVNYKAGPYHPIILTSMNDDTVGETISGSSGNPAQGSYDQDSRGYLNLQSSGSAPEVSAQNMRVCYAGAGINNEGGKTFIVTDCQFVNCDYGVCDNGANLVVLNNDLFGDCSTPINEGEAVDLKLTHVTADNASEFVNDENLYQCCFSIEITNSILSNVTNLIQAWDWSGYAFNMPTTLQNSLITGIPQHMDVVYAQNSYTNVSAAGLYQTVGGGNYYLATNSPYRGAGTTNIDAEVLADISTKTTYPPLVYYTPGIYFSSNLTLNIQAERDDAGNPDMGYHYDPLDYIFGPTYITNATITLNPGTSVGIFGTNVYTYGFCPSYNGQFVSQGQANNLNHIVEYNTVQEQTPPGWKTASYGSVSHFNGTNWLISTRFTDFSVMAQDACHLQVGSINAPLGVRDCQFHGGAIESYETSISLTNCLLERVNLDVEPEDASVPTFRNNTIWNGTFSLWPIYNNAVVFDNLFDGPSVPDGMAGDGITYTGGHNAYVTNCNTLDPTQSGDIILTNSPDYQTSWFGDYYLPTNSALINAGGTNANLLGLYHFTTQTNQVPETNSIVDIGYHYVATDTNGVPLDTNGDDIPDYIEDANGNGLVDSGEIGWNIAGDLGLQVIISKPRNGSTMP